jgi:hypothetical protein
VHETRVFHGCSVDEGFWLGGRSDEHLHTRLTLVRHRASSYCTMETQPAGSTQEITTYIILDSTRLDSDRHTDRDLLQTDLAEEVECANKFRGLSPPPCSFFFFKFVGGT